MSKSMSKVYREWKMSKTALMKMGRLVVVCVSQTDFGFVSRWRDVVCACLFSVWPLIDPSWLNKELGRITQNGEISFIWTPANVRYLSYITEN